MRRIAGLLPTVALLTLHCAGGDNAPSSSPSDVADASPRGTDTTIDAGPSNDSGGAREDEPDDNGDDLNGDGADGVIGRDAYVSVASGSDTNQGTPTAPFRTIQAAALTASRRGGSVLVLAGTYPVDSLEMPGTWAVYGGYRDGFKGTPKRELTILSTTAKGLLLDGADDVRLTHLTVLGNAANDPSQRSAHALRSKVAKLSLDDVVVSAGDGMAGGPGETGAAGTDGVQQGGPLVCDGITQAIYASGAVDTSYEGKPRGDFSAKRRAESGSNGYAGTDGVDATGALSVDGDLAATDVARDGLGDGKPGFGAAAGGASPQYYAGNGGSGGCPGKGGEGGESGGASVALLVLSGHVEIHRSHLQTGIGGVGGDGGEGGSGGHGGWGGSPRTATSAVYPFVCKTPSDDPMQANCAAWGGIGGSGGAGGRGGGGAGGSTVGVMSMGAATATADEATLITTGTPAGGGRGNGGGRAPSGMHASTLHVN